MSFLVHSLLFEPQLSDGAVYLCWGFETVDSWDDGTATDKPLKKNHTSRCWASFSPQRPTSPLTAPWCLAVYEGLAWTLSQERLTPGAKVESELERCEGEAGGVDLPKVTEDRDSPCVWVSPLPVLCSFHFTGKVPKQRRELEGFSEWRG